MLTSKSKVKIARAISRALLLQRRLVGQGPEARVERSGLRWELDLREGIDLSIYLFGQFEVSTVRAYSKLLKPGDTVVDIGANIGAHTLALASCVSPSGRVLAIEPTEYAYQKLQRLMQNNRPLSDIVKTRQVMLTSQTGSDLEPELYSSWALEEGQGPQHELHLGTSKSTRGAQTFTVDDLLREEGVTRVDLIKLDVDGWEMEVLGGAKKTLSTLKPAIVFEVAPYTLEERGHSAEALLGELSSYGYAFSDLNGKAIHDVNRLLRETPRGAGYNLIAKAR
jgi:FkbM family methyltransferase